MMIMTIMMIMGKLTIMMILGILPYNYGRASHLSTSLLYIQETCAAAEKDINTKYSKKSTLKSNKIP